MDPAPSARCSTSEAPRSTGSQCCTVLAVCALGLSGCRAPSKRADVPAVAAPSAAAPSATPTEALATTSTVPAIPASGGIALDGTLQSRLRSRHSGGAHDLDALSVLALDAGDPSRDRVTARVLARVSADLDGRGSSDTQQVFGSLQDTHDGAAHVDVYEASAEIARPFETPARVRAGRQLDTTTPEIAHYDGLRVASEPLGAAKFVVGAFGGVPVRLYDATSIADRIAGAWAEARPWANGRVRADWMHVDQDESATGFHDDLVGLSLWQRVGANLSLDASYSRLEDDDRDVRLRASWNDASSDWLVQASFYRLLTTQRAFAEEFDPFYATLQEQRPFDQYRLLVSKSLLADVRLDVGGDLRRLEDAADEGSLNHDYERGYATLVVSDVLAKDVDASLTGDVWNSDEQDARTWGLDVTWRPDSTWRVSAGSMYALYRYDVVDDVERDDVRVWYAHLRKKLGSDWSVALEYDFEDDESDDFHELVAGATWRF